MDDNILSLYRSIFSSIFWQDSSIFSMDSSIFRLDRSFFSSFFSFLVTILPILGCICSTPGVTSSFSTAIRPKRSYRNDFFRF